MDATETLLVVPQTEVFLQSPYLNEAVDVLNAENKQVARLFRPKIYI